MTGIAGHAPGISGHVRPESLVTLLRNTHLKRITADRPIRGVKESQIYKRHARSVVLILTKDSLGTGTLISSDGDIITNYHVVKGFLEVGVVFKPITDGLKIGDADLLRARVIKVDEVADLALIRVDRVP